MLRHHGTKEEGENYTSWDLQSRPTKSTPKLPNFNHHENPR